jgi:hypothetical protein
MNRRLLSSSFLLVVIIGIITTDVANSQTRVEVVLEYGGKDLVGQSLYYLVKEELRKSAAFDLRDSPQGAFIRIRLHTSDSSTPPDGKASAVAVIVTLLPGDSYLHDQVIFMGRDRVREVATLIVAGIDQYLEELFRDAKKSMEKRPK